MFIHPFLKFIFYTKQYIHKNIDWTQFKQLITLNIEKIVLNIQNNEPELIKIFFGDHNPKDILKTLTFKINSENNYILLSYNSSILKIKENFWKPILLWTELSLKSRGVIVDYENLKLISYPFDKFFNVWEFFIPWHSLEELSKVKSDILVSEKLDWSLWQMFLDKNNNIIIWSKWSFNESTESKFATELFNNKYFSHYSNEKKIEIIKLIEFNTLIFEIITRKDFFQIYEENPDNKDFSHIVDYENNDIILIGIRNKSNGILYNNEKELKKIWDYFNLKYTNTFSYSWKIENLISKIKEEKWIEWYVITYSNWLKVKIKTEEYLFLHKAYNNININTITKLIHNWKINSFIKEIPEELHNKIYDIINNLKGIFDEIWDETKNYFEENQLYLLEDKVFYNIIHSKEIIKDNMEIKILKNMFRRKDIDFSKNSILYNNIFKSEIKNIKEIYLSNNT